MKQLIKRVIPRSALSQLRKRRATSTKAFYRFLARQLISSSSDEYSALTYLFEEQEFTPENVIRGYLLGIFPSSYYGDDRTTWHDPNPRGFLPIADFHTPRNLRRVLRQQRFETRVDHDFVAVMEGCAENREKTHITPRYINVYRQLHEMGVAHSVSAWLDGALVGGVYGIAIGGYFASESAFHRVRDASKAATARLTEILKAGGFIHHDTWWFDPDIVQFGGGQISRADFHQKHLRAILTPAQFDPATPRTLSIGQKWDTA